jgi:uncharacterized protein (TIGR02444 family)
MSEPVSKSPFWQFSIKFYAVPGVAQACIELQDEAKVDVNILFYLLWNATQGRAFTKTDVAEIERQIGPWRETAVVPIRNIRRALKSPPPVIEPAVAESLRTRIKAVELEAERLQQEALYGLAQSSRLGRPSASPAKAAQTSIDAYQGVIGPFPPGPLETVLSAFAKFKLGPDYVEVGRKSHELSQAHGHGASTHAAKLAATALDEGKIEEHEFWKAVEGSLTPRDTT